MLILGIDPGVISTGYGIIRVEERRFQVIDYGVIKLDREHELPSRLSGIYESLIKICARYRPGALAMEDVFFNKNVRTALVVGHVRGAVMLAGLHQGMDIFTYTPLEIKQALTGYGRAGKEQVQKMVQIVLGLPEPPQPDHAADALAAAVCHYYSASAWRRIKQEEKR